MMQRTLLTILGIVTGLLVVAGLFLVRGSGPSSASDELLLDDPWPAPAATLHRVDGSPVRPAELADGYAAVFFGYTHCPDVCPITLSEFVRARRALGAAGERLTLVFVTVDPRRDTPERLAEWTGAFGAPVIGLTGSQDEVRDAAWDWGVGVTYRDAETGATSDDPPAADDYLVDHTARTFIVDPAARVVAQLSPDVRGERLVGLLEELLR